jgi:aarF domain-containing kinase
MHAQTGLNVILDLRGLFVKIGQVMSSRADFIPRQYIDVFHTLQDAVPPWSIESVEEIIRDSLDTCQGLQLEEVFDSIDEVLGSASIGQVHKAKLTSGKTVAVKVMHPNAEKMFRDDFKVSKTYFVNDFFSRLGLKPCYLPSLPRSFALYAKLHCLVGIPYCES